MKRVQDLPRAKASISETRKTYTVKIVYDFVMLSCHARTHRRGLAIDYLSKRAKKSEDSSRLGKTITSLKEEADKKNVE